MKNVTKKKTAKATETPATSEKRTRVSNIGGIGVDLVERVPADVKAIEHHVARTEHFDAADKKAAKKKAAKPVSAAKAKRAVHAAVDKFVKEAAAKPATKPTPRKGAAKAKPASKPKGATKTATIIGLLERKGGATAPELLKVTGWQAHSLRGFIAGTLKKLGRKATSDVNAKGERVYAL